MQSRVSSHRTSRMRIPAKMKAVYFARQLIGNEKLFDLYAKNVFQDYERAWQSEPDEELRPVERIALDDFRPERVRDKPVLPFVLYGLFDRAPLSLEDFRTKYGSTLVPTHLSAVKGRDWHDGRMVLMPMCDVVSAIERGENVNVTSSAQLFQDHPELLDRIKCEEIANLFGVTLFREEVFVGANGASSAFHCAAGSNIYVMAGGRKRWILVDPRDSFGMYPLIGLNPRGAIIGSPISTSNSARESGFPLFAKIPKYEALLNPGDILFNPSWWWHEVTNLSVAIGCPLRTMVGGLNNSFFNTLLCLSPFGPSHMVRGYFTQALKGKRRWQLPDKMVLNTFRGKKRRKTK